MTPGTGLARVPELAGREVVLAGRLASLSRAEAHERVVAAGGRLADAPGPATAWVVLPDDGVPLGEDGALSAQLEEARARIERGQALELIGETEFLARLGLSAPSEPRRYTAAQLARILDVPPQRISAWVRAGLIRPVHVAKRLARFDFREVARARALARLAARGVSARRIRASLEALARWWPGASAPLAQLDALEGGGLVVRIDGGKRAEPGGQLFLDFPDGADRGDAHAPLDAAPRGAVPESELWFQRALRLEHEERLEDAVRAYARALQPGERRPEIAFNLGNALYALDRVEDAASAFALALELDPEYVEAWNNLGNALSLLGRHEEARGRFERALALEPEYADAHFNLGETLAALGEVEAARRHWRAYLAHDPDSSWAAEVRARLRRTDPRGVTGPRGA